MNKATFSIVILAPALLLALSACGQDPLVSEKPEPIRPGLTVLPPLEPGTDDPASGDPGVPSETPDTPPAPPTDAKCGLENCHGLDFVCGTDPAEVCTEIYQLGDFCRQYAVCETVGESCQLIPNKRLDACIDCVKECQGLGGEPAFECENECREKI